MTDMIYLMLSWLPTPLFVLAVGVIGIFIFTVMLRLIAFILDFIPFL